MVRHTITRRICRPGWATIALCAVLAGTARGQVATEPAPLPPIPPVASPTPPPASPAAQQAWLNNDPQALDGNRFFPAEAEATGRGQPLVRESWLYRPYSVGGFVGLMRGTALIDDWAAQEQALFGGFRLGWDVSSRCGAEMRLGWSAPEVRDSLRALRAAGTTGDFPLPNRQADLCFWDLDLLYYPWGNTVWRPYFSAGIGMANVNFNDVLGRSWDATYFAAPFGMGLKYWWDDYLALRIEAMDNIVFCGGSSLETLHNFSLTGGVEYRFGGHRRAYWPWNPSRTYW